MTGLLALDDARTQAIDALHAATAIYTRSHIVADLMNRIDWPSQSCSVLADPGCGDGAFLIEALTRLRPTPGDFIAARRVLGWEIHPGACTSARNHIADVLQEMGWCPSSAMKAAQECIRNSDFIEQPPAARSITYLVGNPPYTRFGHLPEQFKELYRAITPMDARGDILDMFLNTCSDVMTDEGAIAFVTSDRWLINESTANLRARLGRRNGIAHLQRIDASTAFYRPKFRRAGTPPRIHPVSIVMTASSSETQAMTLAPIYPTDDGAPADAGDDTVPLSSIADVRLAPWLGPKGIFWFEASNQAIQTIPERYLVPIIDTSDLPPHEDRLAESTHFAIRTHRDEEPDREVAAHLKAWLHLMPPRGRQTTWWLPPEQLPKPPEGGCLLIPRIARRLRVVEMKPGLVAISHNFMCTSAKPGLSLKALKAILEHPDVQSDVALKAPRLENGYLDVRTGFLRAVRIPRRLLEPGQADIS
jgi:tRNA1(Val) A37 N6-methylase TrmN6